MRRHSFGSGLARLVDGVTGAATVAPVNSLSMAAAVPGLRAMSS